MSRSEGAVLSFGYHLDMVDDALGGRRAAWMEDVVTLHWQLLAAGSMLARASVLAISLI